jgi:hypothetical protein
MQQLIIRDSIKKKLLCNGIRGGLVSLLGKRIVFLVQVKDPLSLIP